MIRPANACDPRKLLQVGAIGTIPARRLLDRALRHRIGILRRFASPVSGGKYRTSERVVRANFKSEEKMFESNATVASSLQVMLGRVEALLSARAKTEDALVRTIAMIPTTEIELCVALEIAGEREAEAAIAGTGDAVEAHAAVTGVQARLIALQSRESGLRRKIADFDPLLIEAENELTAARNPWASEQIVAFEREYIAAAEVFAATIRKGLTISAAVGIQLPGLSSVMLPKLSNGQLVEVQITRQELNLTGGRGYKTLAPWDGDDSLEELFVSLSAARSTGDQLRVMTDEVRRRKPDSIPELVPDPVAVQAAKRNAATQFAERNSAAAFQDAFSVARTGGGR